MRGNLNDLLTNLPPELARTVARYGVRLAIDLLETFYTDLAVERAPEQPARKKAGRPPKAPSAKLPTVALATKRATAAKTGWPADPEERKAEMARRQEVRKAKARSGKISAAAKERWEKMTTAQRQARLRGMERGKKRAAKNAKPDEEAAAA